MSTTAGHEAVTTPTPPPSPRSSRGAQLWERYGILGVLLLLVIFMALVAPNFLTVRNGFNVAQSVSINAG